MSARRLDVYEQQSETVGCSGTLRSRCSRKSLSCRSLSCNQSSVSLNPLGAESDDNEQLPSPNQARTSAFSSRVVKLSLSLCLPAAFGQEAVNIPDKSYLEWDYFDFCLKKCPKVCPGIVFWNRLFLSPYWSWWINSFTVQAKEVLPDSKLLSKLSWIQATALTPKDGFGTSLSNMELVYITDFFLALSICNSVVVSSPYQSLHVVSCHTAQNWKCPCAAFIYTILFHRSALSSYLHSCKRTVVNL